MGVVGGRGGLWGGDVWLWLETREGCGAHGGCGRCPPLSPQGGCGCGGSARQHIAAPPHRTRRRLPLLVAAGTERVSARPHRQRGWVGAAPRQPPMSAHNTPSLCPSVSLCVTLSPSTARVGGSWTPTTPSPSAPPLGGGRSLRHPIPLTPRVGVGTHVTPRHPMSSYVILCHPISPHISPSPPDPVCGWGSLPVPLSH